MEQRRRKKDANVRGRDVRGKRTKLNQKFEYLNNILKKVQVEGPLRGTESGQIMEFDLTLKGQGHSFTPEEFIEIMRPDTIDIWQQNKGSSRTKLIYKFRMARYVPTSPEPVEYSDNHIASSIKDLFRGTDLTQLFNEKKAALLTSFAKFEMNGSGWVLDKNLKFIVKIYRYTPLQNANEGVQPSLNINDEDVGGTYFDIGDYFRKKKAIIVPQNNDIYCGLWAFCIAKFKPEKDAGRITKRLREQSKKVDITGVEFPMDKKDMIRLLRNNNTRAHVLCAETNSARIDHYIVDRNPEIILLFIKNPEGKCHWCIIPSLSLLSHLVSSGISKSRRA